MQGQADGGLQTCYVFSPVAESWQHSCATRYSFSIVATSPVMFALQYPMCYLCSEDHLETPKRCHILVLHTAFRMGQRDLWIAGYSLVFI